MERVKASPRRIGARLRFLAEPPPHRGPVWSGCRLAKDSSANPVDSSPVGWFIGLLHIPLEGHARSSWVAIMRSDSRREGPQLFVSGQTRAARDAGRFCFFCAAAAWRYVRESRSTTRSTSDLIAQQKPDRLERAAIGWRGRLELEASHGQTRMPLVSSLVRVSSDVATLPITTVQGSGGPEPRCG